MQPADRPSPTLRETQQWLAALILQSERLEHTTPEHVIAAPARGDRRERLDVYANGYPARVQEAIEESYPAVAHVIGHRATHELVSRYVSALTQHSYNLNDVGAELPRFLRSDPFTGRFPFLPDLADLEWAVTRAFHAHDQAALDPGPLAAWTEKQWQHAVLRFQPAVALVCSPWPIRDLWAARETPIEAIDINLRDRPDRVLVRRAGYEVVCESLPADEATALVMLLAAHRLGDVMEELSTNGCDPTAVSPCFTRWMALGLIVDCWPRQLPPGNGS